MTLRLTASLLALAVVSVLAIPAPVAAQAAPAADAAPRTAWGAPDLGGIWDFRTLIPLERPSEFEGQDTLTDEEAAVFEQRTIQSLNRDNRSSNAAVDVEGAYNDFWWDRGTVVVETRRTSLIIDPPNGRIPALTESAAARMAERDEDSAREEGDDVSDPAVDR